MFFTAERYSSRNHVLLAKLCKRTGQMITRIGRSESPGVMNALHALLSTNTNVQAQAVVLLRSIPDWKATRIVSRFLSSYGHFLSPYMRKKVEETLLPTQAEEATVGSA